MTRKPTNLRALAAFTEAATSLPMTDVTRVRVLIQFPGDDEWLDASGSLFVDQCGICQYFPHEIECCRGLLVCFSGVGTAEGNVVVEATEQKRMRDEEGITRDYEYGR